MSGLCPKYGRFCGYRRLKIHDIFCFHRKDFLNVGMTKRKSLSRISVSSADVPAEVGAWFNVAANLNKSVSKRALIGRIISRFIDRNRGLLVAQVSVFAANHNLEWEQAYVLLASDRKTPYSDADFVWAKSLGPEDHITSKADQVVAAVDRIL